MQGLTDPVPLAFVREFQLSTAYVPLPEPFLDGILSESLKVPARVWRAAMEGILAFDSTAELPALDRPTLVVWGDRDEVFGRADQDRLMEGLPRARLRIYAGTGHDPHWERPEQFTRDLLAFMAETPAGEITR